MDVAEAEAGRGRTWTKASASVVGGSLVLAAAHTGHPDVTEATHSIGPSRRHVVDRPGERPRESCHGPGHEGRIRDADLVGHDPGIDLRCFVRVCDPKHDVHLASAGWSTVTRHCDLSIVHCDCAAVPSEIPDGSCGDGGLVASPLDQKVEHFRVDLPAHMDLAVEFVKCWSARVARQMHSYYVEEAEQADR